MARISGNWSPKFKKSWNWTDLYLWNRQKNFKRYTNQGKDWQECTSLWSHWWTDKQDSYNNRKRISGWRWSS